MKVYFVMDLMNGICVAAERGERSKYKPITEKSLIVRSSNPINVVNKVKPRYLYVADLDRIMGRGDNLDLIKSLTEFVDELIADCGFRSEKELVDLNFKPVIATETFDITKLSLIKENCYVSLDFKGEFLDSSRKFRDWRKAVEFINDINIVEGLIVLAIHSVGTKKPDFKLVEDVITISEKPVLLGGGIGCIDDLEKAKEIGCNGVLIATAVHTKSIPIDIVRRGIF